MDQPNLTPMNLLQQLKTSLSDCEAVAPLLPLLFDSFEKEEDLNLKRETIAILLGPAVRAISIEELDEVLLQPFIPLVRQHLFKVLNSIHSALQFDVSHDSLVPELTKNIEVCVQILSEVENLLVYLISLDKMSVSLVFHLPKNVAEIISKVFIHCERSKDEYKEAFPAMRCELMNLFQKCHKLQLSMFTLLNENLVFNCTFEDEMQLLIDVLDIVSSMAEVVAELDTMSLVAHWKGYAQLSQTYAAHLRPRLEVAGSINYLSENISHQLCSFIKLLKGERKMFFRSLKISSLQLKVLVKLCEHYKGYLGDCLKSLTNCIITLAAHTGAYLRQQGLSEDIISQVTAHVSAGAGPLITHLIADPGFVQEYFQQADKLPSSTMVLQVGYCHLTNLIMKKLIQLSSKDPEVQDLWLKQTLPLVNTVFQILIQGSTSDDLMLVQEGDLYQELLVHTAAFTVATCSADMFPQLELLLMEHLLQPYLWPALFASDLLCLIGRLGTSELCLQLTCLLHEVLSSWPPCDRLRPEWVYTRWTLSRLMLLLSSDHRKHFQARLPPTSTLASDVVTVLNQPVTDDSVSLFNTVVDRFAILGENIVVPTALNQPMPDALYQLWQCMSTPLEVASTESSHWFLGLHSVLITATCKCIQSLSNSQIVQILAVMLKACSCSATLFHCGACELLRTLATNTSNPDTDSNHTLVCERISSLFVQLMQSSNPITKQMAFDTFSYFAHVTKYEQIVADTVASSSHLQTEITDYFEGIPAGSSDKSVIEFLKSFKPKFEHKCRPKVGYCEIEKEDTTNPCKKLKMSVPEEVLNSAIQRIDKDLNFIEEYAGSNVVSEVYGSSLRSILNRIDKVVNDSVL